MSKLTRIAYKAGPVPLKAIHRVGGEPIGISKATWPLFHGKPMVHVLTLGAEAIVVPLPPHVAAVAVFVGSLTENEAFTPDTQESKVVFLSAQDVARGTTSAMDVLGAPMPGEVPPEGTLVMAASTYDFASVREPGGQAEADMDEEEISGAITEFMGAQCDEPIDGCPVYALSAPHVAWLQGAEAPDGHSVLFWFDEQLVPGLNCGTGYMYVCSNDDATDGRAWWQC